jgi:hypothetical protein
MALSDYLERKEPILYLVTMEESRAEAEIQKYCDSRSPAIPLFRWSSTRGLEAVRGGVVESVTLAEEGDPRLQAQAPLLAILRYAVSQCKEDGLFLLKDVHQFLRSGGGYNPAVALTVRALRDAFYELRALGKPRKIVLLCPEVMIPPDLEKELRVCDLPLPNRQDLAGTVARMRRRAQAIKERDRQFVLDTPGGEAFDLAMANAAQGLTQVEVEYILENMLFVERRLDGDSPRRMTREKQQIIRKSGVLEYIPSEELEHLEVGGLEVMLQWLSLRKHVFLNIEQASRDYGIRQVPRGVLLLGISGCGKSLVCKKIAQDWGLALLRLDVGAIFDRYVGASEERIRRALQVAESVAPCILWVDEIEKGFSMSSGGDGGTSARVLGTLLVWMQEKKAPVFIAATANDITSLPPELLRAGRFDNRFFVGCPGDLAREEIFRIHLRSHKLDPGQFDLPALVDKSFGYTGAEIEQSVLDSAYDAFFERRRATTEDILRNIRRNRPLVKSLGKQMSRILQMLDEGRVELASEQTIQVKELIERVGISLV